MIIAFRDLYIAVKKKICNRNICKLHSNWGVYENIPFYTTLN